MHQSSRVELYLFAGMSGYGKTQGVVNMLDFSKPVIALDFRGEIGVKLNRQPLQTRLDFFKELEKPLPLAIYKPGMEDYETYDDIDFFLTLAGCTTNSQIIIDEIDFELKPTEYPKSFGRLIASARTQGLTIYVTAHRLKECPLKLRALGKKVIFHLEEKSDLEYLTGLSGFNEEEIKRLPYYKFVILPKDNLPTETLDLDK